MKPLNRRAVLRGAAGVAIALPFLEAMRPARAARVFPKRLVIMFSGCGTVAKNWNPTGTETDFQLSPILQPLAPHKQDLVVLQGIDNVTAKNQVSANGHHASMGHLLTCTPLRKDDGSDGLGGLAGAASVDQVLGKRNGVTSKFPTLEFGVQADGIEYLGLAARMCYAQTGHAIPAENDPRAAFDRLFGALDTSGAAAIVKVRLRRKSVLDFVIKDYKAFSAKLGADDRARVDAHLTAIEETERQLVSFQPPGDLTLTCGKPTSPGVLNWRDPAAFPKVGELQTQLLVSALACDLTRVATLQWHRAESSLVPAWLGTNRGSHHELSHFGDSDEDAQKQLTTINTWYAGRMAALLKAMKDVPEGDGTLLDNSVVVWINELGKGNNYSLDDLPIVMAGKAGGALRTGRYLRFGNTPHNNLWVSVCNALDLPITVYGDPTVCTGALAGL